MSDHRRTPIRVAQAGDVPALAALWRVSFGISRELAETLDQRLRPHRVLVVDDGAGVTASAQGYDLRQWFGGRPVPTVGVASVATDPRMRGSGLGTAVVAALLERARDRGRALATLYPATVPVYRRMGFEYAGGQTTYRIPIGALPSAPPDDDGLLPVPEDGGQARASFQRLAERENGLTEGEDDDWWPTRVLNQGRTEPRGAVMTGEEVPHGYAAYRQESLGDAWGYRVSCSHLVAHTPEAAVAMLAYFARFKGVGMEFEWHGPLTDPMALLLPEQPLEPVSTFRNMSRILDLPAALEARGYPEVTGSTTFGVDDPLFPDNHGVFGLEAHGGAVQVSRAPQAARGSRAPISIGALSSLFCGYLTPRAAARVGLVDGEDPSLDLLGQLFAGPAPWTPDFF